MTRRGRPAVVGIAGGSGAGKSTVVTRLVSALGSGRVTVVRHDAYYRDRSNLPASERERINYDHPDALDTALLVRHLEDLRQGLSVEVPVYDFVSHVRSTETARAEPRAVVVVDGILVLADARLRPLLDLKVFVDTAGPVRLERRLARDAARRGRSREAVLAQYEATVRPMHDRFVEPSRAHADLVIPDGGHNEEGIRVLVSRVEGLLGVGGAGDPAPD